jgi:hypothetical protein
LIGGVKTMGLIGLFIGPVLMALLLAIWREWLHDGDSEEDIDTEEIDDGDPAAHRPRPRPVIAKAPTSAV